MMTTRTSRSRRWSARLIGLALGLAAGGAVVLDASTAHAALTTSEKAQVRDFVGGARMENAARVRALVARTDLTTEESVAALSDALSPIAWNDARAAFLKEIVFGGASAASRPVLVNAVVRASLARADAIYQRYVGGLDHEPRAIAELIAIYAFIDGQIANAGSPTASTHDPRAGIPPATYQEASRALREHVERQARWLKGDAPIAESAARLRAQAQLTLIDMLPDGASPGEAAEPLGIGGARKAILIESWILLADGGKLTELEVERVRGALHRLPAARVGVAALVLAGGSRDDVRARGSVVVVGTPGAEVDPFTSEVTAGPEPRSGPAAAVIYDLSVRAAKRVLEQRPELKQQAEKDAINAHGDPKLLLGKPRAPGLDHVIGAAVALVVVDAQRAIELAFGRALEQKPESAALLSDAVGVLAATAATGVSANGTAFEVGTGSAARRTKAIARIAPRNDVAEELVLDGTTWTIDRVAPSFVVTEVRRDGKPVSRASLKTLAPLPPPPAKPGAAKPSPSSSPSSSQVPTPKAAPTKTP